MFAVHSAHDIEQQVVSRDNQEIAEPISHRAFERFISLWKRPPTTEQKIKDTSNRAGQCCFLCLEGKEAGQYAVRVPCIRPELDVRVPGGEEMQPRERACESDTAIYHRLVETCFHYQGKWKRWLPFYGVTSVREVKFQFLGVVERDGRLPIFNMIPVDIGKARKKADDTIALEPNSIDIEFGEACFDGIFHSSRCTDMMDMEMPCIKLQIEEARQRKRKLNTRYLLLDCAQNPWSANGLMTLDGMAQESCIFNIEGTDRIVVPERHQRYSQNDELRGLHFALGWQSDRMVYTLPFNMAWTGLGLAVIWLCVIVWAGPTGDWDTAMAFGQLVATSISLLILHTKN